MKKILATLFLLIAIPAFGQYQRLITSAPVAGTNEVQTLTFSGAGTGNFYLSWNGRVTPAIAWSATTATIDSNIQTGLNSIFGVGNTQVVSGTISSGNGTVLVDFQEAYAKQPSGATIAFAIDSTGGTESVALTTPGVLATYRSAPIGAMLLESDVPAWWINTGTVLFSPTWTKVVGSSVNILTVTDTLTKDTSTTGQTLIGTPLQVTAGAYQTWTFDVTIEDSSSSSGGISFGWLLPSGATIYSCGIGQTTSVAAVSFDNIIASATAGSVVSTAASGAAYAGYTCRGRFTTGATAGAVVFEFLKGTSGTAILKKNSIATFKRVS